MCRRPTLSAVALLPLARAAAAQYTWTNNFATDQWNRSDNWTGGAAGTFPNSATATVFDRSGFLNTAGGCFGWALDQAGDTLALAFTPVPEPSSLALGGLAAIGWVTF